ncbi:jg3735 [Pararge aegeria aegeria]|uniref:Jg3735 protein n=1 Tax=Pararge aegeria aegeria TaxID=348720 RepID=A0A8S4RVZ7_9NEOP|nr:jg3735 [Pararge aegeria aegeria]
MRLHRCEGCLAACRPERGARSLVSQLKKARRSPYAAPPSNKETIKMAETKSSPPDNNAPRKFIRLDFKRVAWCRQIIIL